MVRFLAALAALAAVSGAPASHQHNDDAHGGKGEKNPTPGLLVSKFTVSNALDEIFDGNYHATGQNIDGLNVYKGGQQGNKYIYPNTVGDGTLHYIWDTNFNPKDGVLGGMLIKSGDGLPTVRGKGPEMHGRRKGFGDSFRWNPDIKIVPDPASTEACVSFGFGSMMIPCCETCAPADKGLCEKKAASGLAGGSSQAFSGMTCDAALNSWRAAEKAKADAAAAAKKKAEEEAAAAKKKAEEEAAAAKAAAEASRVAGIKQQVADTANKNGVDMADVSAAAGAAAGAYKLSSGASSSDAANAAGTGAAIFGSDEDSDTAKTLMEGGKPTVETSSKSKEAYEDAILTDDPVPAHAGDSAATFAKTLEGDSSEVAAAAGAAAGKIEEKAFDADATEVALEAGQAAAASGAAVGDDVPKSVVSAIAGHAAGEVALDENEDLNAAAEEASKATSAAGGNSAIAEKVKTLTAAGQTAKQGVHGSKVQSFVNAAQEQEKIKAAADPATAGAIGAVDASEDGDNKVITAKTAGEFAALKVEENSGTPAEAGEEAAKAAIASPISVSTAQREKLLATLAAKKPKLGASQAPKATLPPKHRTSNGEKLLISLLCIAVALVAGITFYATYGRSKYTTRTSACGDDNVLGYGIRADVLAAQAPKPYTPEFCEAARASDLERMRIAAPNSEVALRETDAAIDHAKAGGNLEMIMHPERLEKIKQVFYSMDDDSSGTITIAEMVTFAREYKNDAKFSEKRVTHLVKKIDTDGDGVISEAEFVAFFARMTNHIEDDEFNAGIEKYVGTGKKLAHAEQAQFQR